MEIRPVDGGVANVVDPLRVEADRTNTGVKGACGLGALGR